jgi:hypothetical protein
MEMFRYDYGKLRNVMVQLGIPDDQKLDDALLAHGPRTHGVLRIQQSDEGNAPFDRLCDDLIKLLEPTNKIPQDADITAVVFDSLWDARE